MNTPDRKNFIRAIVAASMLGTACEANTTSTVVATAAVPSCRTGITALGPNDTVTVPFIPAVCLEGTSAAEVCNQSDDKVTVVTAGDVEVKHQDGSSTRITGIHRINVPNGTCYSFGQYPTEDIQ